MFMLSLRPRFAGLLVCLLCVLSCSRLLAAEAAPCFDAMKSLVGRWSGRIDDPEKGGVGTVEYRLTGAGSVLMERLFPDSPQEMVTMYHLDGDKLLLTHYCAGGNQPRMVLSQDSTPSLLRFVFTGGTNLVPGKGVYMHAATFQFKGRDELECYWEVLKDGRPAGGHRFFLKRTAGTP